MTQDVYASIDQSQTGITYQESTGSWVFPTPDSIASIPSFEASFTLTPALQYPEEILYDSEDYTLTYTNPCETTEIFV